MNKTPVIGPGLLAAVLSALVGCAGVTVQKETKEEAAAPPPVEAVAGVEAPPVETAPVEAAEGEEAQAAAARPAVIEEVEPGTLADIIGERPLGEELVSEEEITEPEPAVEAAPGPPPAEEMLAEESVEEAYGEKLGMAEPAAPAEPEEKAPRRYAAITPGGELTEQVEEMGRLYTIYFDFDRYTIKEEYADDLAKNAAWLIKNRDVRVRLEGHADERGDVEYNLALGQKRAESVKRYLVRLGVDPSRLSTLSYGEEKPAVPGHNEEAWARNRRVEFHVLD